MTNQQQHKTARWLRTRELRMAQEKLRSAIETAERVAADAREYMEKVDGKP